MPRGVHKAECEIGCAMSTRGTDFVKKINIYIIYNLMENPELEGPFGSARRVIE